MCLLPPSLAPCLSSHPSVLASAHTLTCLESLTPALPSAPVLWRIPLTCQKGRRPRASLWKAAPSSHFPGPSQGRCNADRRWSCAMEKGKGLSLNAWANHTMKANWRCFSSLDRQCAHHQTSTSTGNSSVFYWAQTHMWLFETLQTQYKTLRYAIFQLQWQPHYLEPFSFLQVLQTNPEQSTEHAVLPFTHSSSFSWCCTAYHNQLLWLLQNPNENPADILRFRRNIL